MDKIKIMKTHKLFICVHDCYYMPVNTWCCLKMINNLLLLIFLCTISLKLCSQNDLTNYTSDENVSTFSEDNSNPLDSKYNILFND